jgi:hypothetical protein
MIQTTHKIQPTQLPSTFQKYLALEALASNNISELARKNNTTRKTIYKYKDQAVTAIGNHFDNLKDDEVLNCIATTYRTSSVIENLNSRLRPYIDARKGFKSNRHSFIQFMLNHLPSVKDQVKHEGGRFVHPKCIPKHPISEPCHNYLL